ncbi:S1 RNA-binding domain-containing protein [Streptomyces sp. NPDC088097]|uniref:S1 RNA-binding domain-containing protein n=1 Tax=Streptomyces sp. NPDC088097 TaxID=3365823 RepID=UPI003826F1CB
MPTPPSHPRPAKAPQPGAWHAESATSVLRITPPSPAADPDSPKGRVPYAERSRVADAHRTLVAEAARALGITRFTLDNPMATGFFDFRSRYRDQPPVPEAEFYDGSRVSLESGLALLRSMVLREGPWARLCGADGFHVHVGERGEIYLVSGRPVPELSRRAGEVGLVVEPVARSPYDPALDEIEPALPADDAFWAEVRRLLAARGRLLLEERPVDHAFHWHRLHDTTELSGVRERLAPRARLALWPDLTEDIDAVRGALLRLESPALLVRQRPGDSPSEGPAQAWMGRTDLAYPPLPSGPGHLAALVPVEEADRRPLLAAAVPDADGVLRARRRTNETRGRRLRTYLGSLRRGEVVTGVVATGLDDIGVYVDLDERPGDGPTAGLGEGVGFLRVPEMSWSHFSDVDEVAPVGRRIRAEILDVDPDREMVSLSVKALLPDPWQAYVDVLAPGRVHTGTVERIVPFGVFVRVAGGVTGLVHGAAGPAVGERVRVRVTEFDLAGRRLGLTPVEGRE